MILELKRAFLRDQLIYDLLCIILSSYNFNGDLKVISIEMMGFRVVKQMQFISLFSNWLFIVALTARSYRDCHWFSVLGMVLY